MRETCLRCCLRCCLGFREGSFKQPVAVEFELASETSAEDVVNVTVRQAALRLGVSERRVCQLARDSRVKESIKAGAEWLINRDGEVSSRVPQGACYLSSTSVPPTLVLWTRGCKGSCHSIGSRITGHQALQCPFLLNMQPAVRLRR